MSQPKRTTTKGRRDIDQYLRRQALQHKRDLAAVLSTPEGRRFIWRVIDAMSGAFGPSYDTHGGNMARNEGRRSVGLQLMKECMAQCPDLYVKMLGERVDEDKTFQLLVNACEEDGDDNE